MAQDKLYLSATRPSVPADGSAPSTKGAAEPESGTEWDDAIAVVLFVRKVGIFVRDAANGQEEVEIFVDLVELLAEGITLEEITSRWVTGGRQVGAHGELLLFSPRMGVDP